jgi:DNA-binding CsgD family transcriptional regulator
VHALVGLGRVDEARALAHDELAWTGSFGAPDRHGAALSVCGGLDAGPQWLAWLQKAVEILEGAPTRLEHARALLNLGIGLTARGERHAAREPLARALDVAHRCGAWALVDRTHAELVASGARPRRALRTGPDALTPAESRAARMAAEGLTNREIARALFLTTKTVEGQLSQAYAKLGIRSRADVAHALGEQNSRVPLG